MDKRVYHSLGTKDYDEALQKKNELDNQYKKSESFVKRYEHIFQFKYLLLLTGVFIFLLYSLYSNKKPTVSFDINRDSDKIAIPFNNQNVDSLSSKPNAGQLNLFQSRK